MDDRDCIDFGLSIDDIDANRLIMVGDMLGNDESEVGYISVDEEVDRNEEGDPNEEGDVEFVDIDDGGERNLGKKPFLDQIFDSENDAYEFYNIYGLATGFGVRKSSTYKSKITQKMIFKRFVCDRAGFKSSKAKNVVVDRVVKPRRTVREGCKAKMDISLIDGKWKVKAFEDVHCHELTSPLKRQMHHSHNKFIKTQVVKNLMDDLSTASIHPANIAKAINVSYKGSEIPSKTIRGPKLFFKMELDINGNLRSMFWADSRARDAYLTFSGVIVFDVMYRTNRFRMPFAPFTGVNHHRQSTLFGCALIADETEETFTWLFEQWLNCMFGRAPGCIITDMDGAMRNAIRTVFPNTRHRFYSWHISKHLLEHVPSMRDPTSEFPKDYKKWFYTRQKEDCEVAWENLIQKYHIEENGWLAKMWDVRTHWVPAYFRDTFTAGMTSSARSESINSFFDGYVNQNTSLKEFVEQYDRALIERRKAESQEDFKSKTTKPVLVSRSKLEEEASKSYTNTMFDIFQAEFKDSIDCYHEKVEKSGSVAVYKVRLSVDEKWKWCKVVYDESEGVKATYGA
ncbi:protein FAR1-RELATED SEQUENCE 5-like [Tasmannia lanceolata]|uniref:protein FAR1-RELATED SEQUENCE 5-like n=1 Tax=Tasmannia lanceolata TaxID=3420 RepID=UPI004063046D